MSKKRKTKKLKDRTMYVVSNAGAVAPVVFATLAGACDYLGVSYQTACRGRRSFRRKRIIECSYQASQHKGGKFTKRTEEEMKMAKWRDDITFDDEI